MDSTKIALPNFLKILTSNNISAIKSMGIAQKMSAAPTVSDFEKAHSQDLLKAAGVDHQEAKLVIAALRKAKYIAGSSRTISDLPSTNSESVHDAGASPKKRKRATSSKNEYLPGEPLDALSFDFSEVLDESILQSKATVINRAPLMAAWATVVAERMGFQREEALSIASSYTEMNAISKGVSLGIYKNGEEEELEATKGGSQPYVELMGRRPLYKVQNNRWRALHKGKPAEPNEAFSYIARSFRQTMPSVVGALRLLADSFTPQEINSKAWKLYLQFRPQVRPSAEGWGERSEVRCASILALRDPADVSKEKQKAEENGNPEMLDLVKYELIEQGTSDSREAKRPRITIKDGMNIHD
ncbi:hypothetical protein D9757_002723 [Collybiopsis confluens]|uniref:Uncharacterized protein n=1 Tax=Collybiopsis confluens TaxID=2823264 RepID=A0A8H5ME52_9AGAR|nr:hypothetical protein D9757_002723 [Collybiopsis confluens]